MSRRGYLDWLRGIAVLIMIEAHTLDAWTRLADRRDAVYGWAMIVGGFGAPVFLFLAGIALAMAAQSRVRKGRSEAEAAAMALRRGWQIFGLAFLFRLQSWLISGGTPKLTLFKVDILNVMGISMVVGALLWMLGRTRGRRAALLAVAAIAVTMLTPLVRTTPLLAPLPDVIEWYLRPDPGRGTFTLFPWAGFLLAGGVVGLWLDRAQTPADERRVNLWLAVFGVSLAIAGYEASFLPSIYAEANFWTSSPTFFFLRLGVLMSAIPFAYFWSLTARTLLGPRWGWMSPLQDFGRASLFVYWIHVEIVYGVLTGPIHKALTLPRALLAFGSISLLLFALVKVVETTRITKVTKEFLFSRVFRDLRGLGR
ncbi:MAG: heparan-alpha-glucosaminide N-acetyltransferase domain-containing protein [Vicinamibacterales bacterium]